MNFTTETKRAYRRTALLVAVWLTGFAGVSMAANRVALVVLRDPLMFFVKSII